jgi:S1-C subfamily serine protease
MFETVHSLANADELGAFRADARRETNDVRRLAEQPAAAPPPRLGMTWRKEISGEALQLLILTVNRGSAAEQAGLRVGDLVTQLDGQPILDDLLFRQQVLVAAAPLMLKVERAGEVPRLLHVNLQGTPIRIGLISRTDPVEPGVAIVSHVVYGSPAAVAGIQVNDRIDAVGGRLFKTANEFSQLLDSPGNSLTLQIERHGQVREIELALAPAPPPAP